VSAPSQETNPAPVAPLAGVAVYTMFRGDAAQLVQWCNYHLGAGADHLYVVLDRPEDGLAQTLPNDARITWQPVDEETWSAPYTAQEHNVERRQVDAFRWMARRASADGRRHLAFVDTDELIRLTEPFAAIAERFPEAASFTVPVREMWLAPGDSADEPFSATVALRRSEIAATTLGEAFGWRAQFLRNGLMAHDEGKTIHRLPLAAGDLTVHRPRSSVGAAANVTLPTRSGAILHFDAGSLAAWNARWTARADGRTLATGLGPHRRAQQQFFAHALRGSDQEQRAFFTGFYTLDDAAQAALASAGVLERIDVGDEVRSPLPAPPAATGLHRLPGTATRVDFQFALACNGRFVRPSFATMTSVVAQLGRLGSIRFVVLGDGLRTEEVAHLKALEHTPYDVTVVVHDITADLDRDVGTGDPKRTTFGRIYLVDHLPRQRTVYLDGDVLATRDFRELFTMDLQGACFAGVSDSAALRLVADEAGVPVQQRARLMGITGGEPMEYLNGGVLVFELDHPEFRRLALEARALVVMYGRALVQRDQDAMNLAFTGYKHRLPSRYNYMTQFYLSERAVDGDLPQLKYASADASLVHFSGKIKPWEAPEDEFYNGLYRRLVTEAEELVGVSCGFYFSRPRELRRRWEASRWVEALTERRPGLDTAAGPALGLVDIGPDTLYLQVSAAMRELVATAGLRLVGLVGRAGTAGHDVVLDTPLDRLGEPGVRLGANGLPGVRPLRVDGAGIRRLTADAAAAVELLVLPAGAFPADAFARSLGAVDLRSWTGAGADLPGPRGALESIEAGVLRGWVGSTAPGEAVSLWVDDELVAQTRAWSERADAEPGSSGRRFRFSLVRALGQGADATSELIVRVAGQSGALPGSPLRAGNPLRPRRYDAGRDAWILVPILRPQIRRLAGRVRNKARRVLRPDV